MAQPSYRPLLLPLGLIATILVGWVLKVGAPIIQPLVIALLLTGMLSPVVRLLARFRVPPILSVLSLAGLLLYLAFLGLKIGQQNVAAFIDEAEAAQFVTAQDEELETESAPAYSVLVDGIRAKIGASSLPEDVKNWLEIELQDLVATGRAEQYATEFLQSGVSLSRTFLLVLIYMLFIFAEQVVFRRKMLAVAGDRREEAARVMDTIGRGIQRFVGIKTLTSLATGAMGYGVLVALEVPYALPFALITFLFNFIPYFGSLLAGALPTITALAVSDTWVTGATVAVLYFMINTVIGSYVEPKIMGRELDLSPLVIIVSVVVWTALWGVVGALLAVPLMATLQIVLASIETTRPIAVMLSSGPPKEGGRKPLRRIA